MICRGGFGGWSAGTQALCSLAGDWRRVANNACARDKLLDEHDILTSIVNANLQIHPLTRWTVQRTTKEAYSLISVVAYRGNASDPTSRLVTNLKVHTTTKRAYITNNMQIQNNTTITQKAYSPMLCRLSGRRKRSRRSN